MAKRKSKRHKLEAQKPARNWGVWIAVVSVLALMIGVSLGAWAGSQKPKNVAAGKRPPPETKSPSGPTATATAKQADFNKLLGKWLRPDGGYVLEIRAASESGKLDATYKNPNPINVFKAEASQTSEAVQVFIELRDVNYPGSTYDLTYDSQSDSLQGLYFQAATKQQFEVAFVRMN